MIRDALRRRFDAVYNSAAMRPLVRQEQRMRVRQWYLHGQVGPPPHLHKQRMLRAYAKRHGLRTLVETGTYLGEMVDAQSAYMEAIYTIELDQRLAAMAADRFANNPSVHVLHGDSALVLAELLPSLSGPCLFWLDGHYSGPGTALGDGPTPVVHELDHILGRHMAGDVILIDDARLFTGDKGYPALDWLVQHVRGAHPPRRFASLGDVIRITPLE